MKGLAQKRKEKGLTHKEIAKCLGVAVQTYRNYEYGDREPKIEMLRKLAEFFNCTIEELL